MYDSVLLGIVEDIYRVSEEIKVRKNTDVFYNRTKHLSSEDLQKEIFFEKLKGAELDLDFLATMRMNRTNGDE